VKELFDQENLYSPEVTLVSIQAVREYVSRLWDQYQVAGRRMKTKILSELCRNLEIHRKSANRLMRSAEAPSLGRGKGNRRARYDEATIDLLRRVWREMGYPCSKHVKAGLSDWLTHFDDCPESTRTNLIRMASSTMDRYLAPDRATLRRKLNTGTRRSRNHWITDVPIRNLEKQPTETGHVEVDTVAHCGESLAGTFAWTVTLTDIKSGWTENETVWGKNGHVVMMALREIEARLPFAIKALYFDNGSEFLNDDVVKRFAQHRDRVTAIEVYRSRPYKKNDQCHVEQKNFTHVRELFGYERMEWEKGVSFMNKIYRKDWRLLMNFFRPQMRLLEKWREGSKVFRRMSKPETPYSRLLAAPDLSDDAKASLKAQHASLNPRKLSRGVRRQLRDFRGYQGKKMTGLTKYAA
jgi:hypothetical protein